MSKNVKVNVKDVKYKGVIIKNRAKRRQTIVDEANRNIELVDEQANLCKSILKLVGDFFDKNNKDIYKLDLFIYKNSKIENETGQKSIYKLCKDLPKIVSMGDSEKAFNERFKKELYRLKTNTGTHGDSQKLIIKDFVTSGKFDEKTILSTMADTEKELIKSNDELRKIAELIKSVLVTMLEAINEVKKIRKQN